MAKGDVLIRMKADVGNYNANIAKAHRQFVQFKNDNLSFGGVIKQTSSSIAGMASRYLGAAAAIGAIGEAMRSNVSTALGFEKSMSQLSSLTGMVGKDLEKLKNYAIELGASTTLSASQVADAFRMIGSQQPQLLESGEALKAVTKNAITLSEAAGIDLATAAQTLSTSINQMGGDSTKAERYVNVLAAASQKGAGDIAWLGEALTKSATAAKAVGTDYEELVANLEQLAKAGFDASTAGTALRSIIMNLEKQANQDFKPSVVGLTQAFENLNKANMDLTGYQTIAGKMFATQAKVLAEAAGEARKMTDAITGTNIAEEQAKTNTNNLDGSLKSLSSAWEGLNLHINSSNGLLKIAVDWLKNVVTWADQAFTSAGRAQKRLAELQGGGSGGGKTRVQKQIDMLSGSNQKDTIYNGIVGNYNKLIERRWRAINAYEENHASVTSVLQNLNKQAGTDFKSIQAVRDDITALTTMRDEFISKAKAILNPAAATSNPGSGGDGGSSDPTKTKVKGKTTPVYAEGTIAAQEQLVSDLTKKWKEAGEAVRDDYKAQLDEAQYLLDRMTGKEKFDPTKMGPIADLTGRVPVPDFGVDMKRGKNGNWYDATAPVAPDTIKFSDSLQKRMDYDEKQRIKDNVKQEAKLTDIMSQMNGGISSMVSGIEGLGIELPQGMKDVLGGIQAVTSILTGISTVISTISTIQTIGIFKLANGGVVKAASGYRVPGRTFSGDMIPASLNAGELVLNQAQAGVIANALQDRDFSGGSGIMQPYVDGEKIFLGMNNTSKRMGRGEIVTTGTLRRLGLI